MEPAGWRIVDWTPTSAECSVLKREPVAGFCMHFGMRQSTKHTKIYRKTNQLERNGQIYAAPNRFVGLAHRECLNHMFLFQP